MLGRRLTIDGVAAQIDGWLSATWSYAAVPISHAFGIELLGGMDPRSRPRPDAVWEERPGLRVGGTAPCWWFGTSDGQGLLEIDSGGAVLRIEQTSPVPGVAFFEGVFLFLTTALSASGLIPLHASAAAGPGEGVTLFLGRSGVGKSTTLLRLGASGWRPIMEDSGWLVPETDEVWGWDRCARVDAETLARFGIHPGDQPAADRDGKLLVPYTALPERGDRYGPLERIVLLDRRAGDPAGWETLPPREWVRAGWEAVGVLLDPGGRRVAGEWVEREAALGRYARFNLGDGGLPDRLRPPLTRAQ